MKRFKGAKGFLLLMVLVCLVLAYYAHLSNKNSGLSEETDEDSLTLSASQSALMRNLETNYPSTPREVVKYFSEITQCYYNESHDDQEIYDLGAQMLLIYDDELVANQTESEYYASLKEDIKTYASAGRTVDSYSVSSSLDVETWSEDGYEWARLYCTYNIKQDSLLYQTTLVFILRKDEASHYKIYGWKKVD